MSNTDKQIITIEELQDFNKWVEVLEYSDATFLNFERYIDNYKRGEKLIKEPIPWIKVFDTLVEGIYFEEWETTAEAYIRLVEAHYKTIVKDGKQLQELTKTTPEQYNPDLAGDIQEIFPNKDYNTTDPGFVFDALLMLSNHLRYEVYLYYILSETKDYKTLTEIKPQQFNLPNKWKTLWDNKKQKSKEELILKTIAYKYNLGEVDWGSPPLRDVANHIKAPYSIVLEAYNSLKL